MEHQQIMNCTDSVKSSGVFADIWLSSGVVGICVNEERGVLSSWIQTSSGRCHHRRLRYREGSSSQLASLSIHQFHIIDCRKLKTRTWSSLQRHKVQTRFHENLLYRSGLVICVQWTDGQSSIFRRSAMLRTLLQNTRMLCWLLN